MNFLRVFLLLSIFSNCSTSQHSSFEKIEYASFDVNSYRTEKRDSIYIDLYWSISDKGTMEVYNVDSYHGTQDYYSFQLTESDLKKLNSAFNKKIELKSNLGDVQRKEGQIFAGSYDFFRVTYKDKTIDSICIIAPFMTKKFENTYNFLNNIVFERNERRNIEKFSVSSVFVSSLRACFLRSKYLPPIETLPTTK